MPSYINKYNNLRHSEKRILKHILWGIDYISNPYFPSQRYIADKLDIVRETVNRGTKKLGEEGFIEMKYIKFRSKEYTIPAIILDDINLLELIRSIKK